MERRRGRGRGRGGRGQRFAGRGGGGDGDRESHRPNGRGGTREESRRVASTHRGRRHHGLRKLEELPSLQVPFTVSSAMINGRIFFLVSDEVVVRRGGCGGCPDEPRVFHSGGVLVLLPAQPDSSSLRSSPFVCLLSCSPVCGHGWGWLCVGTGFPIVL